MMINNFDVNIFDRWKRFDFYLLVSMMLMFALTFYRLITLGWETADYTHAYFILPIVLYLILTKKAQLIKNDKLNGSGLALFGIGLATYLFATLNEFMFLEALSFVLVFWAIFKIRFTTDSLKKITFPLVYLIFMIPPPSLAIDTVTLPLKKISTYGSYALLKLFKLPVIVSGAILKVGEHELFIADACSGFRSMVTLLALGALFAYYQDTTVKRKWLIFLSVIPLGIIGNVFRITLTGMISHFIGIKYAEGFFHEFSGMVLFIFTTFGLVLVSHFICKGVKWVKN